MSTVPGTGAWQDAGLEPVVPEQPLRLTDEPDDTPPDPEEYEPGFPRADREGTADEADVVEQDTEVPAEDDDQGDVA
ncbi:hypothetical protein Cch01nite_29700 [Cellulomonas chitinilytica]|uniref:Uncharacterized protein n=1 Tax=Cellulomonas chitinilytica TaxID=398759 RepID=A0A919P5Z9_9CELL|nr:hypothetical protein [Cellulomonas chitinilytica]GIG22246.1 hypothetical protein Cch01nite_29700 [Cellulomonas chitinilytica]